MSTHGKKCGHYACIVSNGKARRVQPSLNPPLVVEKWQETGQDLYGDAARVVVAELKSKRGSDAVENRRLGAAARGGEQHRLLGGERRHGTRASPGVDGITLDHRRQSACVIERNADIADELGRASRESREFRRQRIDADSLPG